LEDGTWSTNLVDGKRWFDVVTSKYPKLVAYTVDYTTTNTVSSYNRYSGHPDEWTTLEMKSGFPKVVLDTRWDVILVDAPLGYPNTGPGRYQSLYMTSLLAKKSQATPRTGVDSVAEGGHALSSSAVHVFVDDYERKVEREFSQQVFGLTPVKVIKRRARVDVPANEQAHFVFGQADLQDDKFNTEDTEDAETAILVPWRYPKAEEGELSSPRIFPKSWVVLVEVNNGYYDFFLNWLYHYNMLRLPLDIVVVAEDSVVKEKLEKDVLPYVPHIRLEQSNLALGPVSLKYNTKEYKALVSARATHILQFLKKDINVIYSDVDTVWRKDPLPYLVAAGDTADAVMQVDTAKFNGLSPYYCTGFMALVSNERTIKLITDWQEALEKAQLNQPVFNQLLHTRSEVRHQPLPKDEFPNGEFYFRKFSDAMRSKAVVVHNNYIQGFLPKKTRFMQKGLWKMADWKTSLDMLPKTSTKEQPTLFSRIGALFSATK
jgi:Nucleotide-diphospho-sugar transferase/Polysaccharide biosynthesis